MEINHYYHDYVVTLNDRRLPEPDVTEAVMFVFLTLTIQTGHGVRDKVTDYWRKRQSNRLLDNYGPVIHTFLWHYDETGRIPAYPWLIKFY